jgi:ketosteroid isomerase-like protein
MSTEREHPDREETSSPRSASGDKEALLALVADDVEWIIPGKDWPLAGTRHGYAGLAKSA